MVLGIDYTDEYTQISYAKNDMKSPESVSISLGERKYLIPTIVCRDNSNGSWATGDRALELIALGEVCFFKNLFSKALWDESEIFDEIEYTYIDALSIFFKSIIESGKLAGDSEAVTEIVITIENVNKNSVELMGDIMSIIGYGDVALSVVSHSESFAYYVLKQSRDLRSSKVAVFDFTNSGFYYRCLNISGVKPCIVSVEEEDISSMMNIQSAEDNVFQEIAQRRLSNEIISGVFLNGVGFTGDWMGKSLEYLCQGRRAFRGQNLFSKGACYGAMFKNLNEDSDYIYLCAGRNRLDLSIVINEQGRNRQLVLLKAGAVWYESGAKIECILDETRNIQFIISNPRDKINRSYTVDLNTFPERPPKTTRVEISISYKNEEELIILIKDLGFGEFFIGTGKVLEKTIKVKDFF